MTPFSLRLALLLLLIILSAPVSGHALALRYWDVNGTSAGAGGASPSGTWGTDANWNTNAAGTDEPEGWIVGHAVFAAGTDAVGAYTVTVDGDQSVADIHFDEGTVTITGGTLLLHGAGDNPATRLISALPGITATINTPLADLNAGGVGFLTKYKMGTVILGGDNVYSGETVIEGGTLRLGASNRIPDTSNLHLTNGVTDNIFNTPATFHTGGFSETLGTLRVQSFDATIDFGDGASALVFADSDSENWSDQLKIVNFTPGVDSLRIGTDNTGFDGPLSMIYFSDLANAPAQMDSNGFITPNLPRFTSVARTAPSTISLSWTSVSGRSYRVHYKDSLDAEWNLLTDVFAGDTTTGTDDTAATPAQRFYSVSLLP